MNVSHLKPYRESLGEGKDIVLLHGWGLHSGIWQFLAQDLKDNYRVHLIDLPGFGRSPIPSDDYDLELLTEQVLSVAPENAIYVGWSLGGVVATQIALEQPERVEKLVCVSSSPKFVEADDWSYAMRTKVMQSFCQFLEEDYEGTVIRFLAIQAMGSETQKEDIKYLKDNVFIHGMPATKALRGGLAMLDDIDQRLDLSKITVPTLRVYGRLDSLVPVDVAEAVQALQPNNSRYVIFPNASHAPFLTNRKAFLKELVSFIENE